MENKRLNTEIEANPPSSHQNEYFSNILKTETKRFSSLILNNSINSIDDKKIYFKIFLLTLQKSPEERTEDEVEAIAKILKEESLFSEFKHNITILRLIARQTKVKQLQAGQFLYSCNTKDENMYKVLKGELSVKKPKDGTTILKSKAELLQNFEDFKLIKDIEVFAKDQSYLIALNYHEYEQALKLQKQNRTIMQMLTKTAIFSKFKRKELQYLIQNSIQICLVSKQVLINEGQAINGYFYFLVEGELAIYKKNYLNKKQIVCYLTEGSLIGEESLFDESKPRCYTVSIQSSHAKILQIACSKLQQTIQYFQLNPNDIFTKKYQDFLAMRDKHYLSKLQQSSQIKINFQVPRNNNKLSPIKQQQMALLLKDVQNYAMQLSHKEKVLQKRYQIGKDYKDCKLISVERPLFGRQDFPNLRSQLIKRFGISEVKSKQNCCKLPHI